MSKVFSIKKGLDIPVKGKARPETVSAPAPDMLGFSPGDFHGVVPKLLVKEGDSVLAGTPLYCDKSTTDIRFVSSVSGVVSEIVRGEKRKILEIRIQADPEMKYISFPVDAPAQLSRDEIKNRLLLSGLWACIKQRPYDCIANPAKTPRDIFITGFDSSPLAPDYEYLLKDELQHLQTGIQALQKLTDGEVFLSTRNEKQQSVFDQLSGVVHHRFEGPHPAGLAGVQINRIAPVAKGEVVYTLTAPEVAIIGKLFNLGKVDLQRPVVLCGPGIRQPHYVKCLPGQSLSGILNGAIHKEMNLRIVAGNVLTGRKASMNDSLPFQCWQITTLAEGEGMHEFLGWALPRFSLFSFSKTYYSSWVQKLFPEREFEPDTRILGGERAFIMSGEIEKVFPMDILPEHLLRTCISGNMEKQENLGIYEVAPEDFALCEYVSTSKMPLQEIVRDALDKLKIENGD